MKRLDLQTAIEQLSSEHQVARIRLHQNNKTNRYRRNQRPISRVASVRPANWDSDCSISVAQGIK